MIFYSKPLLSKNVATKKLTFSAFSSGMNTEIDDAVLPHKYAKLCFNYKVSEGALKTGIGFEELKLPISSEKISDERKILIDENNGIKAIWHYRYYDQDQDMPKHLLMYYTEGGLIYWLFLVHYDPYVYTITSNSIYPNGVPSAVNYRLNGEDCMIFSSPKDGMWKYQVNSVTEKIENGPCIASMCMHYERMFAIMEGQRNRLIFSANLDPTNWNEELDEGGFIEMQDDRGKLNKVVSFNDYIYVFRDFGIARVSAYGDQTSFSVSQLFASSSLIYGNSVCVCGQKIYLLTRDGIHSFDGYTMTKLNLGIEKLFDGIQNDNCSTLFYNGKYYLACRLNFNDEEKVGCEAYEGGYINNALIEIDIKTNETTVYRGMDICSMLSLDDGNFCKFIACFNGEYKQKLGQLTNDGKMFGVPLKKVWKSPKSNMGYPGKLKTVKEIYIKSKTKANITISTEEQQKTYTCKSSPKTERIKTNISGEQIEVKFESEDENSEISCPQITIGVVQ